MSSLVNSALTPFFGTKPQIPTLPTVSLSDMQGKSIAANQAALPGAEALATSTNAFNQQQIQQMLNTMIPGYSGMASTMSKNTAAMLNGEIPADVQDAISRSGSAQALGGGFAGSGMSHDLVARDLGLTSLNLMNQGQNSLESWTGEMAKITEPGQFNVQSAFITPQQEYAATNEQDMQQFQRQLAVNEVAAAPDPVASGLLQTGISALAAFRGGNPQPVNNQSLGFAQSAGGGMGGFGGGWGNLDNAGGNGMGGAGGYGVDAGPSFGAGMGGMV